MEFYATSAQVLATMLIAFAIWFRGIRPIPGDPWTYFMVGQMVLTLGAIGGCAWALHHGHATDFIDRLVQGAYAFSLAGFGALLARYFLHPDDKHSGRIFMAPKSPGSGSPDAGPHPHPHDAGGTEAPRSPEPRPDRPRSAAGHDAPRSDPGGSDSPAPRSGRWSSPTSPGGSGADPDA